jgi:hypothetical protein
MTQRDNVMMSIGGEVTVGRRNGGDDTNWADTNFTEPKNEENKCDRFSWFKWMMKI